MYSKYSLFLQGHLPGCIFIQHVAQSADGPCKARSHCPFNGGTVRPIHWPWRIPIIWSNPRLSFLMASLRQEQSRCEALESCLSAILLTRTDASPLAAGILILHRSFWDVCASSKWTRSNKQETYGFLASRSVLNYSDGCACWVWHISWGMRSYLLGVSSEWWREGGWSEQES